MTNLVREFVDNPIDLKDIYGRALMVLKTKTKISDLPPQARFKTLLTHREGYVAQKKDDKILIVFSDEEKWVSPEMKVEDLEPFTPKLKPIGG